MRSFKEYISESVDVETSSYKNSHSKQPSGNGKWLFFRAGIHHSIDFSVHKEGKDWFQHTGEYHAAKSAAKKWAKSIGHSYIHVAP